MKSSPAHEGAIPESSFFVPVAGGRLRVFQMGSGPRTVLTLHGLSDNHLSVKKIADRLDESYTVLIPDLRGRGASSDLPGPFSLDAHAADCARLLEYFGVAPVVVAGHSMGALIAERLASRRPDQVKGLVLIDGGIVPQNLFQAWWFRRLLKWRLVNAEKVIQTLVGPILQNLRLTFATEQDYFQLWQNHPAFRDIWNEDIKARFQYDLVGQAPEFRSRVSAAAVKDDFIDSLSDIKRLADDLRGTRCPVRLVRAARGLLNQPEPMISDGVLTGWTSALPSLAGTMIPDATHASILSSKRGLEQINVYIQELSNRKAP